MNYRSTQADGKYVHFGGSLIAGADMGSGIELNATSSGAAPTIQPVGDETNKGITIQGKGTGTVTSPVAAAGGVTVGSSGTRLAEVRAFTLQFTPPALSSGLVSGAESTYTVSGVSTGTVLMFTPTNPISALYTVRARCSTVDELVLAWGNIGDSTLGTGESTNRGVLLQFKF
jgi:hypothetical protein